ncbi:hypothetical protein [Photobacterium sp. GSS17]|uniref:hypothetical protein n=1 Tax=Photobacterium sp. GSS17 TaxID=3020715 RepID=UPI0023626D7C|nr:hypothetical protein [Photobacterium sp. GSS17]
MTYPFSVNNIHYQCWFTELNCNLPKLQLLCQHLKREQLPVGQNSFTLDFDLISNIENDSFFEEPEQNEKQTYSGLRVLSNFLIEIITAHNDTYGALFYFAQPASDKLCSFYERFVVLKLTDLGYNYYHDEDGDGWYVFKKS